MFQEKYKHPSKKKPNFVRRIIDVTIAYTIGEKIEPAESKVWTI